MSDRVSLPLAMVVMVTSYSVSELSSLICSVKGGLHTK